MATNVNPGTGLTPTSGIVYQRVHKKDPAHQTEAAKKAGYKSPTVAASKLLDGRQYPARSKWP